jgi:nucleoside phosphorylase
MQNVDVLVAAAFAPEIAPLRGLLGEQLGANVAGLDVVAKAVGIGLPVAAGGIVARIETLRPRAIVLVGTCGAYPGTAVAVGEVVVAHKVRLVSSAVIEARAGFPAPMATTVETSPAIATELRRFGARGVEVATTLAITEDDALAMRIGAQSACEVEHLEAFGVAVASAPYGIPIAVVLGVANRVGRSAHEQWRRHHLAAAGGAARVVEAWLREGAPGLARR